ncbi:sulfatase domain-containing protein [Massilia arenosa]|uniref:Sulfatase domain-containing protein n=1 Tax=Zemynaea arenosa TaxID=2561931 RepID=A0A4Y9S2C7_9BURK|nr:phosphoethanolamine transferase [Massilia arenosa]TFW13678.1 sulfatase domain-containing protein [Massilia arenosa]
MRHLLRPANLYLLVTYVLISAVPFAGNLFGKPVEHPYQVLGIEVIGWIAAWAVFKRPAWFHILLLPAFLALPTELYLFKFYGQGISTHHLGIIAETSPKEAMEFMGSKVWLLAGVLLAVILWFGTTFRVALKTRDLDWADMSRWVALAVLAVGAGVLGWGYEFGIQAKDVEPVVASASIVTDSPVSHSLPSNIHLTKAAGKRPVPPKASPIPSASSVVSAASEEDDEEEETNPDDEAVDGVHKTGLKWRELPHWAKLPFHFDEFAQTWPFGLMARGVDFYNERKYLAELNQRSASFKFGAHQATQDAKPEVVVLVIGESSRYDRWSLNGYERETNPLLKQQENLVVLPDVVTSVSATRLSVPVIISRKPAMQSLKDGFTEKSFLTAYKEAGFKTFWLSNQISFGQFDTPVSVFAKEADVIQFLNLGGFTNASSFDSVLFDPLKIALNDPAPKKLIVLHSLGSHWNYSQRYPAEFDKWKPSLYGVDKPVYTDLKIKPQLNNSYDNAILYTDWFLSNVIDTLKHANELSSLVYVSDHGQTLYDNSCNLAFHGHNTQYEFHVPAFVWYSEQFKERYPGKVEQLVMHRKSRLATENMFHTLLDMGDIRYPTERLDWSFVNPQFKPHKRYVDSYGWTNYDNASFKGDCREVIDKGKPLKQDK